MKVQELITALQKLDPNFDIYAYCEDELLQTPDKMFSVFFIDGVDEQVAITKRDAKGNPTVQFDSGQGARKLAFISMTTDF